MAIKVIGEPSVQTLYKWYVERKLNQALKPQRIVKLTELLTGIVISLQFSSSILGSAINHSCVLFQKCYSTMKTRPSEYQALLPCSCTLRKRIWVYVFLFLFPYVELLGKSWKGKNGFTKKPANFYQVIFTFKF